MHTSADDFKIDPEITKWFVSTWSFLIANGIPLGAIKQEELERAIREASPEHFRKYPTNTKITGMDD